MRRIICIVAVLSLWAAGGVAQVTVPGTAADMGAALSQVGLNGTITVTANLEAEASYLVSTPGITIQGVNPSITIRQHMFIVTVEGVTFRDLVLDGKSTGGVRSVNATLVRVLELAGNFLMENCTVRNPAAGLGNGVVSTGSLGSTNLDILNGAGACVDLRTSDRVTLRNCTMINDDESGVDNEVNVVFNDATAGSGSTLIEGCTFYANSRNVQINVPHAGITIRDNDFLGTDGASDYEGAGIFLMTDYQDAGSPNGPRGTPIRNLVIEGNRFGEPGGRVHANAGIRLDGPIDGVFVRGNVFNAEVQSEAVFSRAYGSTLVFENNQCRNLCTGGAAFRVAARSVDIDPGLEPAALFIDHVVAAGNLFEDNVGNSGIGVGERVGADLAENNTFIRTGGYFNSRRPHTSIIRDNVFQECGTGGGAVEIVTDQAVVTRNTFSNCGSAVVVKSALSVVSGTDEAPVGHVGTFNVIFRPTVRGIMDNSGPDDVLPSPLRSQGLRIVNNTIAFPGTAGIALRGTGIDLFNNIVSAGPVAVTVAGTGGNHAVTFAHRGFNLNFGNSYVGLAPTGTDLLADPRFVGGLVPANASGLALLPDSPALNAGTSNGVDSDFFTEIGAWQELTIDTHVGQGRWELYR